MVTPSADNSSKLEMVSESGSRYASLRTNQKTSSRVTSRYDITKGLYSMSCPRTLRSQAIWSRAQIRTASAPLRTSHLRRRPSLDSRDSPTRSSPRVIMGVAGMAGRPVQTGDRMSSTGSIMAEGTAS